MRWPPPPDWPMADHSRRVLCRPHRWHVQEAGPADAPLILLLHGAGGAAQSWRGVFPLLARTHRVVALDLPGQGFTALGARARTGLAPMAADIATLMRQEGWAPAAVVGHSAGGAIALAMAHDGALPGACIVGINAALQAFDGVAGWLFPVLARALAVTPLTAMAFSATAGTGTVRRLLAGTGSALDDRGVALYRALVGDRGHVDATLSMMAHWSLDGLIAALPDIAHPVTLITGDGDRAVPPATSRDAAARLPGGRHIAVPGLGHLMHEEAPEQVTDLIRDAMS